MVNSVDNILISVGIPFYNAGINFSYAISSVINQSYRNWELILIDDGSTDNSLEVANKFLKMDHRIRVISDGDNKKLPARLNQLIYESKGVYLARMDADDVMHPERLERQLNFLEKNKNYDIVSTGLISIDNNNSIKGFRAVRQLYDDFSTLKLNYPILHPSVMVRKSWYDRNKYSENFPRAEDFELWVRAIGNNDFKAAVLPDLLMYYREEGNLDIYKMINTYKDIMKIYTMYSLSNSLNTEVLKLHLKIFIVKGLYYSGNLQKLASRRNNNFSSKEKQSKFQVILNKTINID